MLTHHADKMQVENDVTATLCTDSPILIPKAAVEQYVAADYAVRVNLKLLSAAKATEMTTSELRLWQQGELQKHRAR